MAETSEESEFTFSDGFKVYMKKFLPKGPPVAKLIFVHGFSDHVGRYYELFPTLASRGIRVTSWDQRGWGRSVKKPSQKGLTGPTSLVLGDVVEVIKSELPSSVPVFIMGHSMGGGIVLSLASLPEYQDLAKDIRGWILESPHISLPPSTQPSNLKVTVGRFVGRLLPHRQLYNKIPANQLTRDPAVMKSVDSDKLCHATGTLEMFAGMLDRADNLDSGRYTPNAAVTSLVIFHGSADQSTSFDASERWIGRQTSIPDKTWHPYDGWSHMLHADLPDTRSVFAKDVGDWILARSDAQVSETVPAEQAKL